MSVNQSGVTRIGVFYDGGFFYHVSNYYNYKHERRARISISGLHRLLRAEIAQREGVDVRYCHIADAHYFRGRLSAQDAKARGVLAKERSFDDVLMYEGITTHYLPLGRDGEKGIDVSMALEVFELAALKGYDVCVLITGDSDFIPLARKLNTMGTRVMVVGCDFTFVDNHGLHRETRTSQGLLNEVTYPLLLNDLVEDRSRRKDPLIRDMFLECRVSESDSPASGSNGIDGGGSCSSSEDECEPEPLDSSTKPTTEAAGEDALKVHHGVIQALKEGYGFIDPLVGAENLFFFHADLCDAVFDELKVGDEVEFLIGCNDQGRCAKRVKILSLRERYVPRPPEVQPAAPGIDLH